MAFQVQNYGVFANALTSELGVNAGAETWNLIGPQLKSYIDEINQLQTELMNGDTKDKKKIRETAKKAYATIQQFRELLTGQKVNYRIYWREQGSENFTIKQLSMQELLNFSTGFLSKDGGKLVLGNLDKALSKMEKNKYSLSLGQLSDEIIDRQNRRYGQVLRSMQRKYYREDKIGGSGFVMKERSRYYKNAIHRTANGKLKWFTRGNIVEALDEQIINKDFDKETFFSNRILGNPLSGFKGGDTRNNKMTSWQIKTNGADLMDIATIKTELNKVLTLLKEMTADGANNNISTITNKVKESFLSDSQIGTMIEHNIEMSVSNIVNNFAQQTASNLSSGASVSWSN